MNGLWWLPVHHFLSFTWIHRYTFIRNGVPQELNTIQPEFAFGELGIEFKIPQTLKNNAKMFNMLFFAFGINQNVIDENHNGFI
jgi:hypothetical protein